MASERVDITVLVVDDDDTSLAIVANILSSWEYKVLTANNVHNALETLRESEGFIDLVITELHISGMNGFEFQKRIKEEFQLPVIMMSADSRKSVMSKSLENGAVLYILKPICADDFKDIRQYAMAARKGRRVTENELLGGEGESSSEKITFQDLDSFVASSATEPKRRKKYGKRKCSQMNKEQQCEGSSRARKKPKVVWTTYLHNMFLLAIKQIGLDKAVPKRILEIMDVPGLTRENVASHLQKYRIFLRKVAERGIIEGLSDRALRSRFASGLSASVIKDIQQRIAQLRVPVQQHYLKRSEQQTGNGSSGTVTASKPDSIQGSILLHDHEVSSSTLVPQLGSGQLHRGQMLQNQQAYNSDSLNQARLGQSSFGSNNRASNFQKPMFGCYENSLYQANSKHNAAPVFPTYGIMGHGLMTSANCLTGGLNYGKPRYKNYGSLGNQNFSYGQRNVNLSWSSNYYPTSNYCGIQLNGGSQMVTTGINQAGFDSVGMLDSVTSNNSFGFISGAPNANIPAALGIGHGSSGLIQGGSASAAGDGNASEFSSALITNATREENVSRLPPLPQQVHDLGNAGNEHQYNANSMSEGQASQLEDNLTELFLMLDDVHLLKEIEQNPHASDEFLIPDISSSCHLMQSLEQTQSAGDVIVPATISSIDQPNEPATTFGKNPNQDWDMDLIEALFGTEPY